MTPDQNIIVSHNSLRTPHSNYKRTLIVIISIHFALLLAMGLFRYWGNMSSLNDLGFFDQAVWGTLHGQWFLDTNNTYGRPINWLGCHFNLFLLLFVPLYAIWPAAEWFALAQALALSVAAWPIFILASRVHGCERTGLLWAVIYLLNPFLLSAAAWDFHPVTLAVPFIAGTLLAIENKNYRLFFICCLCQLLIQEQFGLTVASFGVLWGLKHRDWRHGLLLTVIGILYTVLVLGFIMPALAPSGTHSMIIDPNAHDSRYGWLGGSLFQIFSNSFLHPLWLLKTVMSMDGTISYLILLALPFLGFFLAAPTWLLPTITDLAANILSANPMPRGAISYHSITIVPLLTVASIFGAKRIAPILAKALAITPTKLVLLVTLAISYVLVPLPLPGAANFWRPVKWIQYPDPALKQIRTLVAESKSVSVQANVGAHFSQRQQVYRYPYKVEEADTIVLCLDSPTSNILPHDRHMIGTVAHHLQMSPTEYLASIECLLQNPAYGVILWNNPWLVVTRGPDFLNADKAILTKIDTLRQSWQITSKEYETVLRECVIKLK